MKCPYCPHVCSVTIPSIPDRVCLNHAIEFWTGLVAFGARRYRILDDIAVLTDLPMPMLVSQDARLADVSKTPVTVLPARPAYSFESKFSLTQSDKLGKTRHPRKLTEANVREIRNRYAAKHLTGVTQGSLALEYGVSSQLISNIIYRRAWAHIS